MSLFVQHDQLSLKDLQDPMLAKLNSWMRDVVAQFGRHDDAIAASFGAKGSSSSGTTSTTQVQQTIVETVAASGSGSGAGATKFTELLDAPGSYGGAAGYSLKVNGGATGIAFVPTVVPINLQAGTSYPLTQSDAGGLVVLGNSLPVGLTLDSGLYQYLWAIIANIGTGIVTATPSSGQVNGRNSLQLSTGQWAVVVFDGTNWRALVSQAVNQTPTPLVYNDDLVFFNHDVVMAGV